MRQRFLLSHAGQSNDLTIQEYAVVDKEVGKKMGPIVQEDDYSFLCEETYDGAVISGAIAKGRDALMRTLRTPNMFPTSDQMVKIVESVIALYDEDEENQSVEIFFDDVDFLMAEAEEALP